MVRILVTGACGFIGYALVRRLAELGYDVVAFVHEGSKRKNSDFQVPVIRGDIRNPKDLEKIGEVSCIHHLAANSDPTDFSVDMVETNVLGTRNVLEVARKYATKVIVASSSAVYGNRPPPDKEENILEPLNAYANTKIVSEYLCKAYTKEYGLNIVVLRYFNTYGIGEEIKGNDASMVFQFVQSLLKKNFVEIYGDGSQCRDFIYVKDVLEANVLAMNQKEISGQVFNVGGGLNTSYNELVHIIQTLFGKEIEVRHIENPIKKQYQFHTQADLTKVSIGLDFKPKYTLEEGIQEIIQHYKR